MSMSRRWWRVMRGLGRSAGDSLRRPGPDERRIRDEAAEARAQARADLDAAIPPAVSGRMEAGGDTLPDLSPLDQPAARTVEAPPAVGPLSVPGDALALHYATLELPAGADIERVEHAYRRLKERWDPERYANDPMQQTRARQQDARLDEAYLALKQALVRERRL